ncbi:MAG TPA: SCO5717 family growth-regulating ATPase, partial [Streptomyces sp.]|nr:SCO5717 family growth-regulating ATPase [Streptomyces sp.]
MSSDRDEIRWGRTAPDTDRADADNSPELDTESTGQFTIDYTPPAWYTQDADSAAAPNTPGVGGNPSGPTPPPPPPVMGPPQPLPGSQSPPPVAPAPAPVMPEPVPPTPPPAPEAYRAPASDDQQDFSAGEPRTSVIRAARAPHAFPGTDAAAPPLQDGSGRTGEFGERSGEFGQPSDGGTSGGGAEPDAAFEPVPSDTSAASAPSAPQFPTLAPADEGDAADSETTPGEEPSSSDEPELPAEGDLEADTGGSGSVPATSSTPPDDSADSDDGDPAGDGFAYSAVEGAGSEDGTSGGDSASVTGAPSPEDGERSEMPSAPQPA